MKRFLSLAILVLGCFAYANDALAVELPVFPGAEGFGRFTYGGGGRHLSTPNTTVYKVTNLNNSGTGSLRACIDASGPRVCVFETSGTIVLSSSLSIRKPYITIAGQTAPSPGITIRGRMFQVRANHVLIQHIRIRYGDQSGEGDAFNYAPGAQNVVVDHASVSWGTDGTMDWNTGSGPNITVSNSFITESLEKANHSQGAHSKIMLIRFGNSNISLVKNLIAHGRERSPLIQYEVEFINNLIYDYGKWGARITNGGRRVTFIGNSYKSGPESLNADIMTCGAGSLAVTSATKLYMEDNMDDGNVPSDQWSLATCIPTGAQVSTPPIRSNIVTIPSTQVEGFVLSNAGARPADRDDVDTRIISEVRNRTGSIIDSQNEVGGWPVLAQNTRSLTLPTNPNSFSNVCNTQGTQCYTNLEVWLYACAQVVETGDGNCDDSELLVGTTPPDTTPPAPPSALRVQ